VQQSHALTAADQRLRWAGLRIVREHGGSRIRPTHDHLRERRDLSRVQAHARGLKPFEYRAAYKAYTGQKITAPNETRRRVVIGGLANVGVLDLNGDEPALSEAARFAHPEQDGSSWFLVNDPAEKDVHAAVRAALASRIRAR